MMLRWAFILPLAVNAAVVPIDPSAVNNPTQEPVAMGAKGAAVVRAQILLARAHFSCGEIDGIFGSNFQKAVNAYQDTRKLPVSGAVDAATWAAINGDTAPPLIEYTV